MEPHRSSRKHKDSDREHHHHHRRRSERARSEERERSHEREGSNKRKERGGVSEEEEEDKYYEAREKRIRVSDSRKERRRFEDKVAAAEDERDRHERREKNRVNKQDMDGHGDDNTINAGGSNANGGTSGPHSKAFGTPHETPLAPSHHPSKVSLISTKHENEGVNSNRSHKVPGKSSTDGSSADAGKSGSISLDALSKVKANLLRQKELAERMKKLPLLNKGVDSSTERSGQMSAKESHKASYSPGIPPPPSQAASNSSTQQLGGTMPQLTGLTAQKFEAVKRAQELATKLGFRQDPEFAPLINMFPGQMPTEVTIQPKPAKAPVLRLDALGREVDEHGNVVNIPKLNNLSTLKVNINKQKKDAFQILKPELEVNIVYKVTGGTCPQKLMQMDNKPPDKDRWVRKVNFVEERSYWNVFRSFNRMWTFFILCL